MKNLVCLAALLALAPVAARAQSDPYANNPYSNESVRQQQQRNGNAEYERQQQESRNSGGSSTGPREKFFRAPRYGQMFTGKTAEERRRAKQRKANARKE